MRKKLISSTPDMNGWTLIICGLGIFILLAILSFFALPVLTDPALSHGRVGSPDCLMAAFVVFAPIGGVAIWMMSKGAALVERAKFAGALQAETWGVIRPGGAFSVVVTVPLQQPAIVTEAFVRLYREEWPLANTPAPYRNRTF